MINKRAFTDWRVVALAALMASGSVAAEPNKLEYELAERCGQSAAQWFKREYTDTIVDLGESIRQASFENHFNRGLNKCLILLRVTLNNTKTKTFLVAFRLVDVNENKDLGNYLRNGPGNHEERCWVQHDTCSSEEQWYALAKPLMEG